MENPYVEMRYTLADGKRVCLKVSIEVKNLIEHTDRRNRSQQRQERRRHMEYVDGLTDTTTTLPQEDFADLVIKMDSYKQLYAAIATLSEIQWCRIYLHYFKDYTYRQIAEIENVHFKTVARSIERALTKMRTLMPM